MEQSSGKFITQRHMVMILWGPRTQFWRFLTHFNFWLWLPLRISYRYFISNGFRYRYS